MHHYCVTHSRNLHVLLYLVAIHFVYVLQCNDEGKGREGESGGGGGEEGRGYIQNLFCAALLLRMSLSALQDTSSLN